MSGMLIATTLSFLAAAQSEAEPFRPVFSCMLRQGRASVLISGSALRLHYRAGSGRRIILVRGPETKVRRLEARFTGRYEHLRFEQGQNSFVVYSRDANSQTGTGPLSGLVVFRRGQRAAEHRCRQQASFTWLTGDEILLKALPEDSEDFLAL